MFICYDNASDYMLHSYKKRMVSSNFTTTTSKMRKEYFIKLNVRIVAYGSFQFNYHAIAVEKSLAQWQAGMKRNPS